MRVGVRLARWSRGLPRAAGVGAGGRGRGRRGLGGVVGEAGREPPRVHRRGAPRGVRVTRRRASERAAVIPNVTPRRPHPRPHCGISPRPRSRPARSRSWPGAAGAAHQPAPGRRAPTACWRSGRATTSHPGTTRRRRTSSPRGWMSRACAQATRVTVARRDQQGGVLVDERGARGADGRARVALLAEPAPGRAGAQRPGVGARSRASSCPRWGLATAGGSRCATALSPAGNDHVHVVVQLVDEDGKPANVHNDRPRAQETLPRARAAPRAAAGRGPAGQARRAGDELPAALPGRARAPATSGSPRPMPDREPARRRGCGSRAPARASEGGVRAAAPRGRCARPPAVRGRAR